MSEFVTEKDQTDTECSFEIYIYEIIKTKYYHYLFIETVAPGLSYDDKLKDFRDDANFENYCNEYEVLQRGKPALLKLDPKTIKFHVWKTF